MNLEDTKEEAAFREEVRGWLSGKAPLRDGLKAEKKLTEEEAMKRSRAWQSQKAEAGYAAIRWPRRFGGLEGTPIQSVIYAQEERKYETGGGSHFEIGLGMCIPTLMAYADEETLARYVRPALYGEEVWCQLFSEPGSGSDAAGARTRAERDGDDWIINGQKVWTTGAHYSDYGILLARSDFDAPKHKGMTFFYLDMKSPGVEVRPIRQMSGESHFNEVFFKDVRVSDSQRLGGVGDGWKVAVTTLMNERLAVGFGASGERNWDAVLSAARGVRRPGGGTALDDPRVRERIADWHIKTEGLRYTKYRAWTALSRGETPGPEMSMAKVVAATRGQEIGAFMTDLMDMGGALAGDEGLAGGTFGRQWIAAAGMRIAGGTDEILRNIISERVLGMPQEARVDKHVPFSEVPHGR